MYNVKYVLRYISDLAEWSVTLNMSLSDWNLNILMVSVQNPSMDNNNLSTLLGSIFIRILLVFSSCNVGMLCLHLEALRIVYTLIKCVQL